MSDAFWVEGPVGAVQSVDDMLLGAVTPAAPGPTCETVGAPRVTGLTVARSSPALALSH